MSLSDRLTRDIASAMKARESTRLTALRMLKTAVTNKAVERARPLDSGEEQQVVATLIKQRRDSIEQFRTGARHDLVAKEEEEIRVLETYLPPPVSAEALEEAVARAVAETGASSAKDVGKVMKAVMAALADQMVDGRRVNEMVRRKLGA